MLHQRNLKLGKMFSNTNCIVSWKRLFCWGSWGKNQIKKWRQTAMFTTVTLLIFKKILPTYLAVPMQLRVTVTLDWLITFLVLIWRPLQPQTCVQDIFFFNEAVSLLWYFSLFRLDFFCTASPNYSSLSNPCIIIVQCKCSCKETNE